MTNGNAPALPTQRPSENPTDDSDDAGPDPGWASRPPKAIRDDAEAVLRWRDGIAERDEWLRSAGLLRRERLQWMLKCNQDRITNLRDKHGLRPGGTGAKNGEVLYDMSSVADAVASEYVEGTTHG